MAVKLSEHQTSAINRLRPGTILVGGVGTGKSRTALAYYFTKIGKGVLSTSTTSFAKMKKNVPLYIITTARKRDTLDWEKEMANFGLMPDAATIDSWNNITKYAKVKDSFFIFDEQRLVGSGVWANTMLKLSKYNNWVVLSATPGDTWMDYITIFVANGFYKHRTEFIQRHVVYDPWVKFPKVKKYLDVEHLEKLKKQITIPMDYKTDVNRHHQWILCDYITEDYEKVMEDRWNIFENKPVKNISQACYLARIISNAHCSRFEKIDTILARHDRALIFYNFDFELELLKNYCTERRIEYKEWNGHVHQAIPASDRWVYLVHYSSAEGWNCIETDCTIFYSQNYSYKATIQAAGRIDRMNTPYKDLWFYHLYSNSPIDKTIKACYQRKKDFNESIFAGENKDTRAR